MTDGISDMEIKGTRSYFEGIDLEKGRQYHKYKKC